MTAIDTQTETPGNGALPLTPAEKLWVFRKATGGFLLHYAKPDMTDDELTQALARGLGIFGGSGGPGELSVAYQGAGLKIWGGRSSPNIVTDSPLFESKTTLAMAREVYDIRDPTDRQMQLF